MTLTRVVILLLNKGCFQAYNIRVPGHEVAGVIDEIGKNVTNWKPGQRGRDIGSAKSVINGKIQWTTEASKKDNR
jgi:Alcohol dehydrogenase GroES-like domain